MATVKLQDGKVVLKDGKVSCSCCETVLCPDRFDIKDTNTFEITREEFLAYYSGGIWTINVSEIRNETAVDIRENPPTPNFVSATAFFEFSFEMKPFTQFGCRKIFTYLDFTTDITVSGTRFIPGGGSGIINNVPWGVFFDFSITTTNNKYYAKYYCATRIVSSEPPGGIILNRGTTMLADGNGLISNLKIGDIYSAILYQDGDPINQYENNSTSVVAMNFTSYEL